MEPDDRDSTAGAGPGQPRPDDRADGTGGDGRGRSRRRRERKERVLHTRISEQLAEDIRVMADELRVPVSNLVRNVLEEAFTMVETVTDNVGELIEDVVEEADRARERVRRRRRRAGSRPWTESRTAESSGPPRADFPEVIGWQPLILNREQPCADCSEPMERGDRAFAGATEQGFASLYLCTDCMDARR